MGLLCLARCGLGSVTKIFVFFFFWAFFSPLKVEQINFGLALLQILFYFSDFSSIFFLINLRVFLI